MKTIIAASGQTLMDIVLTHCGTIEALMDVAIYNNLPADSEMNIGDEIVIPDGVPVVADVVEYFSEHNINISTKALNGL